MKILAGNPGGRPLNKHEPVPEGDLSDPPAWLSPSQQEGWRFAIEHAPAGLLKNLDTAVLAIWVVAEDLHRQAVLAVGQFGLITRSPTKGEPMQNPCLAIVNKQALIMLKAAAEMGFTPSSRTRIQVAPQAKANKFEKFGKRPA